MRDMLLHLAALTAILAVLPDGTAAPVPAPKKPKVEVVFCLDTTGSMGGLIDGAKAKIWAMCNQIANGKPTPDLKVGLVAYRDKGDDFVTKVFELTDDLDKMHGELKKFTAGGGGDHPEHVNAALDDAVNKIKWSDDKKTLKIIFLVGDAPPHMDYADDVKYPETCKKAVTKNIIINTIQCGNSADTTTVWKDIAKKSEGSYVNIPQDGGVVAIETPFDGKLAALNARLSKTVMVYGDAKEQAAVNLRNAAAGELKGDAAASRVAYQAKNFQAATYCLIDQLKQNKVKLEDIKKDNLPKELQGKSVKEQKEIIAKIEKDREAINKEVIDLDKQRSTYIDKKRAEDAKAGKAGFDAKVLDVIRNQAKKYEIDY